MSKMDRYHGRLLAILSEIPSELSEPRRELVASLIHGGEGPEAMLALAWTIVEENLLVSRDLVAELRHLAGDFIDPADFPPDLDAHVAP